MMPGINPRKMQQMMKKMGMSQDEIEAVQVIIRTKDNEIVFDDPQVSKVNMMGQMSYQVVGDSYQRPLSSGSSVPEISQEDIETVMEQASVDEETARQAIIDNNGDLAEAIIQLTEG